MTCLEGDIEPNPKQMDNQLWNEILQFDLDEPASEYGFSTRLAHENVWTKSFTAQAIVEYKKFMYLAATSGQMVSPSEIIDVVWHQHLIFTQSYQAFCMLLGKQVHHIPSTRSKEEHEKFKQAQEQTKQLYQLAFGQLPPLIWEYDNMLESLQLNKAKHKTSSFVVIGIIIFILLFIPLYTLLKPVYVRIDNPYFIIGFIAVAVITFISLEMFNRKRLRQIVDTFDKDAFIFHLDPLELIYLKTQSLTNVLNGIINELIENSIIVVYPNHSLALQCNDPVCSVEQLQVVNVLQDSGNVSYPALLKHLTAKPVFRIIANSMDAFRKHFIQSKQFKKIFCINFGVLALLFMLGFIRLTTGMIRDKPVDQLMIILFILFVIIRSFIYRFTAMICTDIIPNLYKKDILPACRVEEHRQWNYFLMGDAVLASSFLPLVKRAGNVDGGDSSSGSSCGSSCGGGCGSCGGCGGD